ncbi:Alpha/Beta hydrolase protein [Apodospora peruviana]|uniref:Alpha/Beta hydrolase protein n=1 Tax=Apodospora peruviana TaxID=516989 RepID=A0AAE0M0L6_9PEZI|nr:Alpha/Beta hydrolase protein [Apodospora peruviana]
MASTFRLPTGRTISYSLSYNDEPSRPTVLLSNSLSSQYAFWDHIVSVLHSAGLRVLRYDHPGHGNSGVPDDLASTTFASLAEDVYALLTSPALTTCFTGKHAPDAPFTPLLHAWIGVSMGAALGIVFATTYPGIIQRLVICDTISSSPANAGVEDAFAPRVAAARESGAMAKTVTATMERWFGKEWIEANAEEAERVKALMGKTTLDGFETCVAALRSHTFDIRPLFAQVGQAVERVLLVVGEKDADLPKQMARMRDEVQKGFGEKQQVKLEVIPDAGHVCFIDGMDEFLKAVMPFLEEKIAATE